MSRYIYIEIRDLYCADDDRYHGWVFMENILFYRRIVAMQRMEAVWEQKAPLARR